jgi:hypothetical protein
MSTSCQPSPPTSCGTTCSTVSQCSIEIPSTITPAPGYQVTLEAWPTTTDDDAFISSVASGVQSLIDLYFTDGGTVDSSGPLSSPSGLPTTSPLTTTATTPPPPTTTSASPTTITTPPPTTTTSPPTTTPPPPPPSPTTTTTPPPPPPRTYSNLVLIGDYAACPYPGYPCAEEYEIFDATISNNQYSFDGCNPGHAIYTTVVSTVIIPTAIPSLGPFDTHGMSGCSYTGNLGLSCVSDANCYYCNTTVCPNTELECGDSNGYDYASLDVVCEF